MLSVTYFYRNNSGSCLLQIQFIKNLEKNFKKQVEFKKIDVDKNKGSITKYQITEIPTVIIENDGKLKEKFSGLTQETFLKKAIERNMKL